MNSVDRPNVGSGGLSKSQDSIYAPIALFLYNRAEHAKRTIEALKKNELADESDLIIFSDSAKLGADEEKVNATRQFIRGIDGFKSIKIVERSENFGLARSIIEGVTDILNEFGRVIVMEDDLVTSPFFLRFMNDGLDFYEHHQEVASIHGYVYPIKNLPETFFMRGADCWGWATWRDRWTMFEPAGAPLLDRLKQQHLTRRFDFNGAYPYTKMLRDQIAGKNNSWAIRWHASAFLNNKFTLYPGKSLVLNIGNDGSGTHCGVTDGFSSELAAEPVKVGGIEIAEDQQSFRMFEDYFRTQDVGMRGKVRRLAAYIAGRIN